jgi:hypothetical protein
MFHSLEMVVVLNVARFGESSALCCEEKLVDSN